MLVVSLILNAIVVFPVSFLILARPDRAQRVFGPVAAAARILASVYLAIGLVSLAALALFAAKGGAAVWALAWPLLTLQVIYKLITVPTVGLRNPVVIANLAIVAVHLVTLWAGSPAA